MHLLMAGMTNGKGGKETYMIGMTRELVKLGNTVDFLTVDDPMAYQDEMSALGCGIYHIPKRNEHPIGHRKAITCLLNSKSYDVIWSHKTTLSSIDDLEIAKSAGVPIRIVHSHCTENMGGKFTAIMHAVNRMRIGNIANCYFACSNDAGKYFYPSNIHTQVVKNAFDVSRYVYNGEARKQARDKLGISENVFVLSHVGRFSPEKNHEKILRVFASLRVKESNSVLLLCGEGPTLQESKELADELGIADSVHFLGAVDDIPAILSSSDVFIFPSIHEGLPYALLEAQANGLPCIVSDSIDCNGFQMEYICSLNNSESDAIWADQCRAFASKRTMTPCATFIKEYDLAEEAIRINSQMQRMRLEKNYSESFAKE